MKDKYILVVGGAGYIGSHTNKLLHESGYKTIVLDNLSRGFEQLARWGTFIKGDFGDRELLKEIFTNYEVSAVMHFSAFAYVGESVENPMMYYQNNVIKTLNLLDVMRLHDVKQFIFSSTCATFGEPQYIPVDELHVQKTMSPYGTSKLMVENLLKDFEKVYGLNHVILRYFNAAGGDPDGLIGEMHDPEPHLIPLVLDAAMGRRENIKVFGNDYPTEDGTCVRDYIHVYDLAKAHIQALEWMERNKTSNDFNLGNGQGFSVSDIIKTVEKVTELPVPVEVVDRRPGDPALIVGSADKAKSVLGWKPKFDSIESIIETAWNWHCKLHKYEKKTA